MDNKNLFLGANLAVVVNDEDEFNQLKEWMGTCNLFLVNKEPVSKMNYPGPSAAIYRAPSGDCAVYWSTIKEVTATGYKVIELDPFIKSIETKVIEGTDTVVNEVSNIDLDVSITSVVPAVITSNIKDLKEVTIPKIKQYAQTVVTAENYKDIDGMLTNLRGARKTLNDGKIATKKEASKTIIAFEEDVKEILAAFDGVIEHLATQTESFKNAEKEAKRNKLQSQIDVLKTKMVENKMISQEYADKFIFDEKWSNKSTTEKAFREAVDKQFTELIEQEKKDKEVLDSIIETIKAQNVPEGLMSSDKYIRLYQTGTSLPEVLKTVTSDGISIRGSIEKEKSKAVENARENIVQETIQNLEQGVQIVQESTQSVQEKSMIDHVDEKTGEIYAKNDDEKIIMKIQEDKDPSKIYKYTYEFEGNFKAIKTLSNFLKVLSKINKTFKSSGKKVN